MNKYLVIVSGGWFGYAYYVEAINECEANVRVFNTIHEVAFNGEPQELTTDNYFGRGEYKAYRLDKMNANLLGGDIVELLEARD